MGLLPFLGSDDSNDACNHHHWGEYTEVWHSFSTRMDIANERVPSAKFQSGGRMMDLVKIEVPKRAQCQHAGCDATDHDSFPNEYYVPRAILSQSKHDMEAIRAVSQVGVEEPDAMKKALEHGVDEIEDERGKVMVERLIEIL